MIYDSFMFFHELDLLDVRLRVLYPVVDYFILQESTYTHAGAPKPLYYENNKDRYAWAKDKIIHIVLDDPVPDHETDFDLENHQRQNLYDAAKAIGKPDDILLISDVDEIPSREVLLNIEGYKLPVIFEQDLYYYNINTPLYKKWLGTQAMRFKDGTDDLMRKDRSKKTGTAGGWHLSYFMTPEEMIEKVKSFAHHKTYGNTPWTDIDRLKQHMKDHTSFLEKPMGKEKPLPLPEYLTSALYPYMCAS